MIYTGNGLTVRICVQPTRYHHWMAFACFSSMRRFLPDATMELAIFGRPGLFFDWASRLRIPFLRRKPIRPAPMLEADKPGMLVLCPECIAVRPWDDDRLMTDSMVTRTGTACLRWDKEYEISDVFCVNAKSDSYAPLADVSGGLGSFVLSEWIDKDVSFLAHRFVTGSDTQMELAVLEEWQRAANLATCLGLN